MATITLHKNARTTPAIRREIQQSNLSERALAKKYGLRRASGLDIRPHDLRRTCATFLTGMGCPEVVLKAILNHRDGGVTRIYDRNKYDEPKRQWLERWDRKLQRACPANMIF